MSKKDGTKKCSKCGETDKSKFTNAVYRICRTCTALRMANRKLRPKKCKCGETDESKFSDGVYISCKACAEIYTVNRKLRPKKCKCGETDESKFSDGTHGSCKACVEIYSVSRKLRPKKCKCGETDKSKFNDGTPYVCKACAKIYTVNRKLRPKKCKCGETDESKFSANNHISCQSCVRLRQDSKRLEIAERKIAMGNKGDDYLYYVIKFTSIQQPSVSFYKYGITEYDIKVRFRGYSKYDIDVIAEFYGDKSFITGMESKILTLTKDDLFVFPNGLEFGKGGKTECRTKIDMELVESIYEEYIHQQLDELGADFI